MGSFALYGIFSRKLLLLSDSLSLFVKKGGGAVLGLESGKLSKNLPCQVLCIASGKAIFFLEKTYEKKITMIDIILFCTSQGSPEKQNQWCISRGSNLTYKGFHRINHKTKRLTVHTVTMCRAFEKAGNSERIASTGVGLVCRWVSIWTSGSTFMLCI